MNFRGHQIDPVAFWERYVEFPPNTKLDDVFAGKTQCPNPEHDTLKKHFQVNLSEPKVHCFAYCGISGSYEHAVCVIEGLYEKFGVDQKAVSAAFDTHTSERSKDDREQIRRWKRAQHQAKKLILRNAPKFQGRPVVRKKARGSRPIEAVPAESLAYERFLPPLALDYVEERGLTGNSVAKWELGWLPEEKRLVIPARDLNGRLRFLIKRSLMDRQQPKYLYTEGFPKTSLLFGGCYIDLGLVHSDALILVEGSVDTISFHQDGFANTGGILGTGISDEQVRIIEKLRPKRIIFAFDKDAAGIRNIEIAERKLRKYPLYVMKYPQAKGDPAELTRKEKERQISRAVPLFKFHRATRMHQRPRKEIYGTQT